MKCEKCEGRGFIEYEHGLLMVGCEACNGTGEIDDSPSYLIIPEPLPGKTIDETVEIAREIIEASKDDKPIENGDDLRSPSGDDLSHPTTGSPNPSQPKQPQKSKAKKKSTKRSS